MDAVRYYVLHEMPFENDGNLTWELVAERTNSDLANTLGNLVNRTISMSNKYFGGVVENKNAQLTENDAAVDADLKQTVTGTYAKVVAKMEELRVADALTEIFNLFKSTFENVVSPYSISEVHFQQKDGGIVTQVTSSFNGKTVTTEAAGNGRLDAVSNALKKAYELKFTLVTYQEHALEKSTSSKAIAYVGIQKPDGTLSWGAGVDPDIIRASIDALVTAINNR